MLILAFFLYLSISILYWIPPTIHSFKTEVIAVDTSGDPGTYIWFLAWWTHAFKHWTNPFYTNMIWAPTGVGLAWDGHLMPTAGIFLAPITRIWGPIVSYNFLTILSPPLAAIGTFLLVRSLMCGFFGSLIAGYIFGFSSYELAQLLGHLNLDTIFILPFAVFLAVLFFQNRISNLYFVLGMSICLTIQFGLSIEIYATASFFGFVSWLVAYLMFGKKIKNELRRLLKYSAISYVSSSLVISPYLYYLLLQLRETPKIFNSPSIYSADLLNFFIPTPITWIGGDYLMAITQRFTGNYVEDGAYLGILTLILMLYVIGNHTATKVRFLAIITGIIFMASLGPYIHFAGVKMLPSLWWPFTHIPILRQALPTRFTLFISFLVAITTALWIKESPHKFLTYSLSIAAVLSLVPNLHQHQWWSSKKVNVPAFFQPNNYQHILKKNENVLILPFNPQPGVNTMLWQVIDHWYFRVAGGFTQYVPPSFQNWPVLSTFYSEQPIPQFRKNMLCFLRGNQITTLIVAGPDQKSWRRLLLRTDIGEEKIFGRITYYQVKRNQLIPDDDCGSTTNDRGLLPKN